MLQDAFNRLQTEELGVLLFMAVLRTEDLKRLFSVLQRNIFRQFSFADGFGLENNF
jgi:hypothetical protein